MKKRLIDIDLQGSLNRSVDSIWILVRHDRMASEKVCYSMTDGYDDGDDDDGVEIGERLHVCMARTQQLANLRWIYGSIDSLIA